MALPIIPKASFPYTSKWLKGKLTYHPFTVGLESILLQVKDSKDKTEKLNAIRQILEDCVAGADVMALPLFIVEDLFIRIREKSSGESVQATYICTNAVDKVTGKNEDGSDIIAQGVECATPVHVDINLKDVKLAQEGEHKLVFQITEDIGVKMRYPSLETSIGENAPEDIVLGCIESVFDAETVHPTEGSTNEELMVFWNSVPLSKKKEITQLFFQSMPSLSYTIQAVCPGCGYVHEQKIDSLNSIFT